MNEGPYTKDEAMSLLYEAGQIVLDHEGDFKAVHAALNAAHKAGVEEGRQLERADMEEWRKIADEAATGDRSALLAYLRHTRK